MKKEMTVELLKAQFKGLAVDMTSTIEYLEDGIAWLDAEIKKEELKMNKSMVNGVGRIVNGRLTYVSTKGGLSVPVTIKGADFDQEVMEMQVGTVEVFHPLFPETDIQGADFDDTPEGKEILEGEVIDVRFPVEKTEVKGADFDDAPEGLKLMEEIRNSIRGQKGVRFPLGSDLVHGADFDETAEGLKLMEQLRNRKGGK